MLSRRPNLLAAVALVSAALLAPPSRAAEPAPDPLADLSLEQLLNSPVVVSSVSRRPASVQQSPAAVTIVSQEDLRRSGATTLAEALRLVPGMNVARVDAHEWAISARGFNDLFANKLLVMMDGRSVYTSAFSGTFWDVQDTLLEDVARIEVIRGPGAALWGANAVNGVVNVVSKNAASTQGWLISGGAGNEELGFGGLRYGGRIGEHLHFRVYGKYNRRDGSAVFGTGFPETLIQIELPGGGGSVGSGASPPTATHDDWETARGGFRADWSPASANLVTVQGDIYDTDAHQLYQRITPESFGSFYQHAHESASGGNLLARWTHTFSNRSESILQAYYDRTDRQLPVLGERREAFDLDFQHQFSAGDRHTLLWGAGYRLISDRYRNSIEVALDPASRDTQLFGAFVQDEIALVPRKLAVTLGTRFEHNDFTGFEIQPDLRLLWTPDRQTTFWSSISRAVRTPSRAENDFRVNFPGVGAGVIAPGFPAITIGILGSRDLEPELLTAYELGYRAQLTDRLHVEASVFYNEYDNLRSFAAIAPTFDLTVSPLEINATMENGATGRTYGGEISANLRITPRWRLRADYAHLRTEIRTDSNVTLGSLGTESATGTNPRHQAALRSWLDLPHGFELDVALRHVSALPLLDVPAYTELDLRLGWRLSPAVELSLVGHNLLDRSHPEFKPSFFGTQATELQRSLYGKLTLRF